MGYSVGGAIMVFDSFMGFIYLFLSHPFDNKITNQTLLP